jgi:murein DD-endopeptidase MepM/ murein hydrolase activator NlpD
MFTLVERFGSRTWSRLALFGIIAVGAAGCSAETARFGDNTGSVQRHAGSAGDATGSVPVAQTAPLGRVEAQPLPQQQTAALPAPPPPQQPAAAAPVRTAAAPPAAPAAAAAPQRQAAQHAPSAGGRWEWDGGTSIIVKKGETLHTIARKHNVPLGVIMQANAISSPEWVHPGYRLTIPRHIPALVTRIATTGAAGGQAPQVQAGAKVAATQPAQTSAKVTATQQASAVHVVAPGETLTSIAKKYNKPLVAIASANNIVPHTQVKMGDKLTIPGVKAVAQPGMQLAAAKSAAAPPAKPAQALPKNQVVSADPAASVRMVSPVDNPPTTEAPKNEPAAAATPGFRWPVRGRVITGFGPKPTGQQNDGINVAVPEGTPVKAAEDGVVAYAGSELKGYGNLVLVRHSNGYVTAYAHASELMVKRGDTIKRGQLIAKAGQTGNVASPQLHFEIRKGSAPIDPMPFLDKGGGA